MKFPSIQLNKKLKIGLVISLLIAILSITAFFAAGPILTNISTSSAQKRLNQTVQELNTGKNNIKIAPIKQDTDGNGQSTGVAFDSDNRSFLIFSCSTNWGPLSLLDSPKCILKDIDFNNTRGEPISDFRAAIFRGPDGDVAKVHAQEFVDSLGLKGKLILADSVKGDENNFNVNLILDEPVTTPDGRTTSQILLRVDKKWTVFPPGFKYLGGATPTLNAGGAGTNIRNQQPITR
jgi:hypothetical protein